MTSHSGERELLAPAIGAEPSDLATAHRRQRIIDATIELVAKRGYNGTSIDHILKASRVGHAAFYEFFETKQECFLAAFEEIASDVRAALEAGVGAELEWPERICAGLRILIEMVASNPARARVAMVEIQAAGPAGLSAYEKAIDAVIPNFREGKAFSPDASALSETLEEATVGGIAWIVRLRLVRGERAQVADLLGDAIQIALSPYIGEEKAILMARAAST